MSSLFSIATTFCPIAEAGAEDWEELVAVETRQLEGTLANREEALEWVKTEYSLG